jgi:hypothetical protein
MKVYLLLLLLAGNSYATIPTKSEVRSSFQNAAEKEASCRALIKMLEGYDEKNNPLLAGYKACATMMMARYVFNPFTKLSYFSKGRSLLEKCIAADKQNIELRFLRYSVQRKAPFFLNYRSSLKQDEGMITQALLHVEDTELKQIIVDFLKSEKVI